MGKKRTARIDIDGINENTYSRFRLKIQRTYPDILVGYLSKKSWTRFCTEVDRTIAPLAETSYTVLCPLLFIPVVGCCIIGHHVQKTAKEQRQFVLENLQDLCKETSNAGVRFYLREEEFEKPPTQEPIIFIEVTVLESINPL